MKKPVILTVDDDPEVLNAVERDLRQHFRADYRIVETYRFRDDEPLLSCGITAIGGDRDELSEADLLGWREVTGGDFRLNMMAGGHFFLHDQGEALTALLGAKANGKGRP